ncbi:hydrolase TatD [Nostoc sp. 3335mG]|nr:hydrolase TatD [Nostoc sp. 3335mG]
MIDTHCHLDLYEDPVAVAAEAARRGVYVISVTTTPTAYIGTKALEPRGGRIRTALGLHPELAANRIHELDLFRRHLATTKYVGEVGIDGSTPHRHTVDQQGRVLLSIFDMCAAAGGKTISIHSRGAVDMVLDLIEQEPLAGRFVLHWFSGTFTQLSRAVHLGCWFSVGPAMLRSTRGMQIALKLPVDKVLPESDGPFGTVADRPVLPWEANGVASSLARAWGTSIKEAEAFMVGNFQELVRQTEAGHYAR